MDNNEGIIEWKRAHVAIKKFAEATSVHLELLANHIKTIKRDWSAKDYNGLIREKCNADRTIRQVVNDMQQMMLIGANLNRHDIFRFELEINPLKRKVENAIQEFLNVCDKYVLPYDKIHLIDDSTNNEAETLDNRFSIQTTSSDVDYSFLIDELKRDEEAHQQLMKDVSDLNECMHELSNLIESQHRTVDLIEDNIDRTVENVNKGEKYLKQAVHYKVTLCGALIGAAIGGPAGMFIGFKTAALAAIGGSALGAYGSHLFKKRAESRRNSVAHELKPLNSSHEKFN